MQDSLMHMVDILLSYVFSTNPVGQNGDYALTFYNIPETYLVGMNFRILE